MPAETTRGHLRHVGWLIEEVVRGCQEKVGLAQAAYDSVCTTPFLGLESILTGFEGRQTHTTT